MDSCNSESLQSSSGGDEEYNSRANSISALFNPTATTLLPTQLNPQTSSSSSSQLFDTLSYLDVTCCNPNNSFSHHLDLPWPHTTTALQRPSQPSPNPNPNSTPMIPSSSTPLQQPSIAATTSSTRSTSKKRSRASRRAPTTVLTTDTSNFRAMVQEFTGIPAPPFAPSSSSSSFALPRTRFDLFHPASSLSSAAALSAVDPSQTSPYQLLRPCFPHQKDQAPSTTNATSCSSKPNATTTATHNINLTTPSNYNYQLPSSPDLGGLLNTQNPFLQSLLQSPKYTTSTLQPPMSVFSGAAMKSQRQPTAIPSDQVPNYDGDHINGLPRFVGSEVGVQPRWNRVSASSTEECPNAQSNFNVDKGSEILPARGTTESVVDSWICSSD